RSIIWFQRREAAQSACSMRRKLTGCKASSEASVTTIGCGARRAGSGRGGETTAGATAGRSSAPTTMQLQQRHAATDLLELMQGRAPVQPLANESRQCPTGQVRLLVDGLLNA